MLAKRKKKKKKSTNRDTENYYLQQQQNSLQVYLLEQHRNAGNSSSQIKYKSGNGYHKSPSMFTKKLNQLPNIPYQHDQTMATMYNGGFGTKDTLGQEQQRKLHQTKVHFYQKSANIQSIYGMEPINVTQEKNDLDKGNPSKEITQEKSEDVTLENSKAPLKRSFLEVQTSVDNKTYQDMQQNYKLPSIRSNESIRDQNESKLTTLQSQSKKPDAVKNVYTLNNEIANKILNESKEILAQHQKARGANKFVAQNRTFIKELMDNPSYRSIQDSHKQNTIATNPSTSKAQAKVEITSTITEEEKQIYGNRCPKGYKKLSVLGRGGCALVWLGVDDRNEKQVAMKQFPKSASNSGNLESGYKELQMNRRFWQFNGEPYEAYVNHPGINTLCKLLDSRDEKTDLWLIFEVCGRPLSKQLFDVKGEFFRGERIYQVLHKQDMFGLFEGNKCEIFKSFITKMAQVLHLFQTAGIVHSDLKPENIMLTQDDNQKLDFKIIDLGSSFSFFKTSEQLELTTPEYLAPDILEFLDNKTAFLMQGTSSGVDITRRLLPYSIDIWSLGAILLELVIGFPLWLSYKGRIVKENQNSTAEQQASFCMQGLFGIQGRVPKKILLKQQQTVKSLKSILKKQFSSDLCLGGLNKNEQFLDLLQKMLELNPRLRISPKEVEEHPFVKCE